MEAILVHRLDFPCVAECSCLWRGDRNMAGDVDMAAPAVLHSLLWLQMVLHSLHPFQVELHSPRYCQMALNSPSFVNSQ